LGKSRSRFIVEELDNRLKLLEDGEGTKMYDQACTDPDASAYDQAVAEEMFAISAVREAEEEEKW